MLEMKLPPFEYSMVELTAQVWQAGVFAEAFLLLHRKQCPCRPTSAARKPRCLYGVLFDPPSRPHSRTQLPRRLVLAEVAREEHCV